MLIFIGFLCSLREIIMWYLIRQKNKGAFRLTCSLFKTFKIVLCGMASLIQVSSASLSPGAIIEKGRRAYGNDLIVYCTTWISKRRTLQIRCSTSNGLPLIIPLLCFDCGKKPKESARLHLSANVGRSSGFSWYCCTELGRSLPRIPGYDLSAKMDTDKKHFKMVELARFWGCIGKKEASL